MAASPLAKCAFMPSAPACMAPWPTGRDEVDAARASETPRCVSDDGRREREVDRDLLAVGPQEVDRGRLLIARVVAPQVEPLAAASAPTAWRQTRIDGDVDHVHAHRVARGEHEAGEHASPEHVRVQLHETTVRGRLLGDLASARAGARAATARSAIASRVSAEHEAGRDVERVARRRTRSPRRPR